MTYGINIHYLPGMSCINRFWAGVDFVWEARKINTDPPSVTRSRKNAHAKLTYAASDIDWAMRAGIIVSEPNVYRANSLTTLYTFFL